MSINRNKPAPAAAPLKTTQLTFPYDPAYQDMATSLFARVKALKGSDFYRRRYPFSTSQRNTCHAACIYTNMDFAPRYAALSQTYDLSYRTVHKRQSMRVRTVKIDIRYWRYCRFSAARLAPVIGIDFKTRELALLSLHLMAELDDETLCQMLTFTPMLQGDRIAKPFGSIHDQKLAPLKLFGTMPRP